jgi:hypothetical protein
MTTITTTCAGCGRTLAIPERYLGRDLKCPDCGHPLRVAAPEAAPPAPPEPPFSAPVFPDPAPPGPVPMTPFEELDAPPPGDTPLPTAAVYWRVKRVGALSAATVSAVVYALLGLLVGIGVAIASLVAPVAAIPFLRGPLLGAVAIVALPLAYAAIGFLLGLAGAAAYNLAARLAGGIKLLLE